MFFEDDGEVRVVAMARPRTARLLAVPPGRGSRSGRSRGRGGSGAGLGLATEKLLLAQTQLGAELFDLLLEEGLPLKGAVVHDLPVAGLSPGLKLLGEARANGTGAVRDGRRGAGGGGQEDRPRVSSNREGRHGAHADRCTRDRSTGQCSWPVYRMFTR